MYIHLGNDTVIAADELIAILNIPEKRDGSDAIVKVIKNAETKKKLKIINDHEKARALIICHDQVYISGISSHTLYKRAINPYREESLHEQE